MLSEAETSLIILVSDRFCSPSTVIEYSRCEY